MDIPDTVMNTYLARLQARKNGTFGSTTLPVQNVTVTMPTNPQVALVAEDGKQVVVEEGEMKNNKNKVVVRKVKSEKKPVKQSKNASSLVTPVRPAPVVRSLGDTIPFLQNKAKVSANNTPFPDSMMKNKTD